MSNNILDEVEKHKGPRTCPECGHQFPFGKFVKIFIMSYGLSKWPCHGCRELLKSDFIVIQIIWFGGTLVYGVLLGLLAHYFDLEVINIINLIPFLVFVLLPLYYAKFKKYEWSDFKSVQVKSVEWQLAATKKGEYQMVLPFLIHTCIKYNENENRCVLKYR